MKRVRVDTPCGSINSDDTGVRVAHTQDDWAVTVLYDGHVKVWSGGVLLMSIDLHDMIIKLAED